MAIAIFQDKPPEVGNLRPMKRKEALSRQSKWYFTGRECKHGHLAVRRTTTGHCTDCEKDNFFNGIEGRYNVSREEYAERLKVQGGKCDICKVCLEDDKPEQLRINIDHCHKTGAFRGVLCARCNQGLGMFQESHEILERAMDYVKRRVW